MKRLNQKGKNVVPNCRVVLPVWMHFPYQRIPDTVGRVGFAKTEVILGLLRKAEADPIVSRFGGRSIFRWYMADACPL